MPYINADGLLPPELLREVQRYVQGTMVYVPKAGGRRLAWGARNGARDALDRRNDEIRSGHRAGRTVEELADRYGLSEDAIRKALYGRGARRDDGTDRTAG